MSVIIGVFCLTGVEVNQEQEFVVDSKGAGGQGQLEVTLVIVVLLFLYFFMASCKGETFSLPALVCVCG